MYTHKVLGGHAYSPALIQVLFRTIWHVFCYVHHDIPVYSMSFFTRTVSLAAVKLLVSNIHLMLACAMMFLCDVRDVMELACSHRSIERGRIRLDHGARAGFLHPKIKTYPVWVRGMVRADTARSETARYTCRANISALSLTIARLNRQKLKLVIKPIKQILIIQLKFHNQFT